MQLGNVLGNRSLLIACRTITSSCSQLTPYAISPVRCALSLKRSAKRSSSSNQWNDANRTVEEWSTSRHTSPAVSFVSMLLDLVQCNNMGSMSTCFNTNVLYGMLSNSQVLFNMKIFCTSFPPDGSLSSTAFIQTKKGFGSFLIYQRLMSHLFN